MHEIILYTNHCPRCIVLKDKLDSAEIEYKINSNIDEMLKQGITQVPMLDIGGKLLNFSEAVKFIQRS